MLAILKTYANKGNNLSVVFSYEAKVEGGATFSLFSGSEAITVDFTHEDLATLAGLFNEARYATETPLQF